MERALESVERKATSAMVAEALATLEGGDFWKQVEKELMLLGSPQLTEMIADPEEYFGNETFSQDGRMNMLQLITLVQSGALTAATELKEILKKLSRA